MKKLKENSAITLIALVITIIVLLILAGVTISTLSGENGLLNRAKTAKETSQNASIDENATLDEYSNSVDKYLSSTRTESTDTTSGYSIVKLGEATGLTPITIDATQYDEVYVETMCSDGPIYCSYDIKTITLQDNDKMYLGNALYSGPGLWSSIYASKTSIRIESVRRDGTDYTSTSTIIVYGINY